jgi:hypothetical protein
LPKLTLAIGLPESGHWSSYLKINTGTSLTRSKVLVVLPVISCFSHEWPKAPITNKSACFDATNSREFKFEVQLYE